MLPGGLTRSFPGNLGRRNSFTGSLTGGLTGNGILGGGLGLGGPFSPFSNAINRARNAGKLAKYCFYIIQYQNLITIVFFICFVKSE